MTADGTEQNSARRGTGILQDLKSSCRYDFPILSQLFEAGLASVASDAAASFLPGYVLPGLMASQGADEDGPIDRALSRLAENGDEVDIEIDGAQGLPARIRLSPGTPDLGDGTFLMSFDAAATALIEPELPAFGIETPRTKETVRSVMLAMRNEEEVGIALRALARFSGWETDSGPSGPEAEDRAEALADDRTWLVAHLYRLCWSRPVAISAPLSEGIERAGLPSLAALGLDGAEATRHVVRNRSGAAVEIAYVFEQKANDPDAVWQELHDCFGMVPAGRMGGVDFAVHLSWSNDLGKSEPPFDLSDDRDLSFVSRSPSFARVVFKPETNVRAPRSVEHSISGRMCMQADINLPHPASDAVLKALVSGRIGEARKTMAEALSLGVIFAPPVYDMPGGPAVAQRFAVVPTQGTALVDHPGAGTDGGRSLRHGTALIRCGAADYDEEDREWIPVEGRDADGNGITGWVTSDDLRVLPRHQAAQDGKGRVNPVLEWQGWRRHRVVGGETLAVMSDFYGCPMHEIRTQNSHHLINPDILWPGDVVYLSPPPASRE